MTAVAPPVVDVLPPTPARLTDTPVQYVGKTDAWQGAMPTFRTQLNGAAAATYQNALAAESAAVIAEAASVTALGSTALVATSDTPIAMTDGTTAVTLNGVSADIDFEDGEILRAQRLGDPAIYLIGEMQNRVGLVFDFVVGENGVEGTGGPYDDWSFVSARFYASGATKQQALAMLRDDVPITPLVQKEMLEPFALTDGATVTPSGLDGLDYTWPIGGNRTLAPITNTYPGAAGTIEITQDATGSRILAVGGANVWRRRGGLGVLSTAAGKIDELEYKVRAVDGSGTATRITYDIIKDPT